ncbi:MAG: serine hydrolase [Chitinophagaceae bacterium]|nr:serine hydrolase [Chitinophagaceae bacterium]
MKKIFVLLILILNGFIVLAQPSFIKDSLDSYVQEGIKDWSIPGLAVSIVHNNEVVVNKGFGVRNILSNEPVDENTLFIIASNSKLFTGTALAKLEYEKKLSLDDKIIKYFPDFKLYNATSTSLVTIKDMLSHRIGTKTFQGDFTFWNSALTRSQVMHKMRLLKPSTDFRSSYGYCNSCFLTAGEVIPKVTKSSWEKYVYDSLVVPLNMFRTKTLTNNIAALDNIASPYSNSFTGLLTQLPYDNIDNLAPATSMVSCVKDMSNWLLMQLDSGKLYGKQILPWAVVAKTRDIVTPISSRKRGATHFTGYGLGLFMSDYHGKQIFNHTGGADGFVTSTCFIPEINLGIAVLTNNDNQNFFEILRWQIIDAYLNLPFNNRSKQQLQKFKEDNEKQLKEIKNWKARIVNNKPTLALENYIGTYENELYGTIEISVNENNLKVKFNSHRNLSATMQYMDNDEWMITYNPIMLGIFSTKFEIENKKVKALNIKVSDFVEYDPYLFKKKL